MPLESFPLIFTKIIFKKKIEYLCYKSVSVSGTEREEREGGTQQTHFPFLNMRNHPIALGHVDLDFCHWAARECKCEDKRKLV